MRYKFRGKMHQVIVGDKASLQMPLKAHVYAKKYGNEEARRKRRSDQHNSQRRSKVSTSINTEEATPRVKSLSKEQTTEAGISMISLFGVAATLRLLSFSHSRKNSEKVFNHSWEQCMLVASIVSCIFSVKKKKDVA